jgi:diguanylate cyclase (GGDEF)-like protein
MSMLLLLANAFGSVAARRYQIVWREEYRAQSVLHQMSLNDALTGCFNRNYLQQDLLESELARAQRFKLNLTVIMCDLDHFKQVNDKHGHIGGDLVLAHFGRLLTGMTRARIDSVVRYGGEEFLLVLPETTLEGGVMLAERLRAAMADSVILPGASITASVGVASVDFAVEAPKTLRELISAADRLLYEAKNGGRNQVRS